MKIRWHHQAFTGIAIALYLIVVRMLVASEGWFTLQLFGGDYGLARAKATTLLVVAGERYEIPFDMLAYFGAVIGLGIALTAIWRHFRSNRSVTNT